METLSSSSTSPLHSSYTHSADISASDSSRYFSGRHFSLPSGQDLLFHDDTLKPPAAAEVELMKERFAKLLLGEDMSGSGKGVCTALAVSNAITNLSATVFGELWRLEPLAAPKMAMWVREMEWLLSITDAIVELSPSRQDFPGGGAYEVMVARPRSDLYMNLPALKKLDAMLVGMLDGFRGTEFCYVDRGVLVGDSEDEFPSPSVGRPSSLRQEEKWWLPCPRLPVNGLSEEGRKRLQQCRDCAGQILKAAMAINSGVLAEMEVPDAYFDALPKVRNKVAIAGLHDKGKATLVELETTSYMEQTGEPLCMNRSTIYLRGAGGFSNSSKPYSYANYPANQVSNVKIPNYKPSMVYEDCTQQSQALLYRLSGDYNPLHSDPVVAQVAGFTRPILHGLCSLGFAVRAIIRSCCNGDPTAIKTIFGRFLLHVYPGETLVTEMWIEGPKVIYQTKVKERNRAVLSGYVMLKHISSL